MREERPTQSLAFEDPDRLRALAGPQGEHLRIVEERLGVRIGTRGTRLTVAGAEEAVARALHLLQELYALVERGYPLYPEDVARAASVLEEAPDAHLVDLFFDTVHVTPKGRSVSPRGLGQKRYVDAIRRHDIVFGFGPAGTGKTYLAMAAAVAGLAERRYRRIVLCRPAVEAGEKLGFLPGGLAEKVNPYLRPLYDALDDMMDSERAHELVERGTVEVAPLAFMRGRTLNDAFVILDEAQNTTHEQMKMFLTRLGFGSKAVVTGDVTQIDLPGGIESGLRAAERILSGVEGIAFCYFSERDVVRHPLVQRVIRAYEAAETGGREGAGGTRSESPLQNRG